MSVNPHIRRAGVALRDVRRVVGIRRTCGASYAAAWTGTARHLIHPRRTILFGPQRPMWLYMVFKLSALAGYRVETNPLRRHDVVFRFRDATFDDSLLLPGPDGRVINGDARDVSKAFVQQCWGAAAGYPLVIDPRRHVGLAVCKANANAQHNGRVVECPITDVVPGCVYERLVDNTSHPGVVMEYRVPIHGDAIPLVYLKYRPANLRFDPRLNTHVAVATTSSVFTHDEQVALLRCARLMGIDFGEMDVLRDANDGRIYAVDVNNTPCGPPAPLSAGDKAHALTTLATSFRHLVESFHQ
ncbi:MAG: hypothetical protein ABI625_11270 [bacterium]